MPESPGQNPDSPRKNRSYGAFFLFLAVLAAILIAVGGETMRPQAELTQDQYEWYLYQGLVDSQQFRGSNVIEGTLKPGITELKTDQFRVSFADLGEKEERYRQVKAVLSYEGVSQSALLAALAGDWYRPELVRTLVGYRQQNTSGDDAPATTTEVDKVELTYVQVIARSESEWLADRQASEPGFDPTSAEPSFPLPRDSGTLWVEVTGDRDASTLIGRLTAAGARTERLSFDLSKGKGSSWTDNNSFLTSILLMYLPWVLIFLVLLFFMRQMRSQGGAGGVMSFGRSRAQLYTKENHTNVTFNDVAGAVEAKDEVREVVEFLKNPTRFTRIGGRIPRGVLLVGPPGCGKTLLAKAIAGEAEVPFFSISGSDFVEMFVGVGASRVRDLFKQARENSPCIIFLDEIDAVGRRRGSGMGGGHDEREQTLNAILVEMDGFSTDEGIIVIAATNRPDVLDPALLRPGRFDREVVIDLPDVEGRKEILGVHMKKVKSSKEIDLDTLARSTPGYSGADLAAIINEAAIHAALQKRDAILMDDLEEARDKVRFGRQKKSRKVELEDRKITAYHEAGHAVVAASIPEVDAPHKVTIVPRGRALGATMTLPEKESYHMQKKRLLGQLAVLFGGRVAEAEFCGDISAGASDDIQRATDLARAMVTELGMSDKIGPISYAERQGSDFLGTELMRGRQHSEETAREIDREVAQVLDDAYERAATLVKDKRAEIENLTEALLRYETVSGREVLALLEGTSLDDLRPDEPPTPEPDVVRPGPAATPKADGRDDASGEIAGEPGLSPA